MSNTIRNTFGGLLSAAYLALPGGAPQEVQKAPSKPGGDVFVQVDPTKGQQTKALNQASKAEVKNKPGTPDARDKLFNATDLSKALNADKLILGTDGFPKHDSETLRNLVSIVEKNSSGIAAGFGGIKLAEGQNLKIKTAIAFQGTKMPEQLKGTTLLFPDSKEFKFITPDGKDAGTLKEPVPRHYVKLIAEGTGEVTQDQHIRMSSGTIENPDAIDPKTGTLKSKLKITLRFIGGPTEYKITVDPDAKESSVSEPVKTEKDGKVTKISTNITIPESAVAIWSQAS